MKLSEVEEIEESMQNINNDLRKLVQTIMDINVIPSTDFDTLFRILNKIPGSDIETSAYEPGDHDVDAINAYFHKENGDTFLLCLGFDPKTMKLKSISGQDI